PGLRWSLPALRPVASDARLPGRAHRGALVTSTQRSVARPGRPADLGSGARGGPHPARDRRRADRAAAAWLAGAPAWRAGRPRHHGADARKRMGLLALGGTGLGAPVPRDRARALRGR